MTQSPTESPNSSVSPQTPDTPLPGRQRDQYGRFSVGNTFVRPPGKRDAHGRFVGDQPPSKGRNSAAKVARLRAAIVKQITPADLRVAIKALVKECESGNVSACRELLRRSVGEPLPVDIIEHLAELDRMVARNAVDWEKNPER